MKCFLYSPSWNRMVAPHWSLRPFLALPLVAFLGMTLPLLAQAPTTFSSFHVVDIKQQGVSRAPVINALAIAASQNVLATAGDDHQIRLFAADGNQLIASWASDGWVLDLAFDPTGQYLAAVNERGFLTVWTWKTAATLYRGQLTETALRALAYSPNGQFIAVAGFEPNIFVVEAQTGRIAGQFSSGLRDARDVAFSPHGRLFAVTGGSGRVQLWDVLSGRRLAEQGVSFRRQHAVAFAPDGKTLAVGGEDGVVRVFAVEGASLIPLATLELGEGRVSSLVFCHGGEEIAIGTSLNEIRVFEISSGRELARLRGHTGTVARLVSSQEQAILASGSFDTTIRFWQLPASTVLGERATLSPAHAVRQ